MAWSDTFLSILNDNDVRLITYVPDNVLTPLITGGTADIISCRSAPRGRTRRFGTVSGADMGGLRGAVMTHTCGFALIANALASLLVPSQITAV